MATPNVVRFSLENRKDLCDPMRRAREVENFDRLQAARPLAPPSRPVFEPAPEPKRKRSHRG